MTDTALRIGHLVSKAPKLSFSRHVGGSGSTLTTDVAWTSNRYWAAQTFAVRDIWQAAIGDMPTVAATYKGTGATTVRKDGDGASITRLVPVVADLQPVTRVNVPGIGEVFTRSGKILMAIFEAHDGTRFGINVDYLDVLRATSHPNAELRSAGGLKPAATVHDGEVQAFVMPIRLGS